MLKIKIKCTKRLTYAVAALNGVALIPSAVRTASLIRGYHAFGGEYLLPILFILLVTLVEQIYEMKGEIQR